jgi:hypothetical protein
MFEELDHIDFDDEVGDFTVYRDTGNAEEAVTANAPLRTVGLRANVESATETAKVKKAGRGLLKARPIGIGHAAPAVSITNKDMEKIVETTDDWIKTCTGIENRHVLKGSETLRDLAIQAGKVSCLNDLCC